VSEKTDKLYISNSTFSYSHVTQSNTSLNINLYFWPGFISTVCGRGELITCIRETTKQSLGVVISLSLSRVVV